MKNKTTDYTFKVRLGIDDLTSLNPRDNEWGDYFPSREITDIEPLYQKGEYYDKNSTVYANIATDLNKAYIEKLKEEGKYGKVEEHTLTLIDNPLFDNNTVPSDLVNTVSPTTISHSITFIDFSEDKNPFE